jgi:hypothetical protein
MGSAGIGFADQLAAFAPMLASAMTQANANAMAQTMALVKQLQAVGRPPADLPAVAAKAPRSPLQKGEDAALDCLKHVTYFDVSSLSAYARKKLVSAAFARSSSSEIQVVNGMMQAIERDPLPVTVRDGAARYLDLTQGYRYCLELMLKGSESDFPRSMVLDLQTWLRLVEEYPAGTPESRAMFMSSFHQRHAGALGHPTEGWAALFASNSGDLLNLYMSPAAAMLEGGSRSSSSSRPSHRETGDLDPPAYPSSPPVRTPGGPAGGKRKRSGLKAFCFSRRDPQATKVCDAACLARFDHHCCSCGSDHAAASCPAFDQSKATETFNKRRSDVRAESRADSRGAGGKSSRRS